jgi:D-alanyl-lipoteichoic acid acyltransferase DltB (MBOAT superfamily)
LFFTFLVSGIWHGSKWTFVIWGALNGFYLLFSIWTENIRKDFVRLIGLDNFPNLHRAIKILITFTLTCYAWMFFRANSISDVIYIHRAVALSLLDPFHEIAKFPITLRSFILSLAVIVFLELVHYTQRKREMWDRLAEKPIWFRWAIYYTFILAIYLLGEFGDRQFIYFQF